MGAKFYLGDVDTNVKLVLKWALKKSHATLYPGFFFWGCEWNPLKFLFVGVNGTLISIKYKTFLQQQFLLSEGIVCFQEIVNHSVSDLAAVHVA